MRQYARWHVRYAGSHFSFFFSQVFRNFDCWTGRLLFFVGFTGHHFIVLFCLSVEENSRPLPLTPDVARAMHVCVPPSFPPSVPLVFLFHVAASSRKNDKLRHDKAVKELMILGLISFVLFLLKDQKTYDQSDEVLTNTFDVRTTGSAYGPPTASHLVHEKESRTQKEHLPGLSIIRSDYPRRNLC